MSGMLYADDRYRSADEKEMTMRHTLDIVVTKAGYGVIIGITPPRYPTGDEQMDDDHTEYRVQLVDVVRDDTDHGARYSAGFIGLFNGDQLCGQGFCENDNEQALVLCAAAGVAFSSHSRYSVAC